MFDFFKKLFYPIVAILDFITKYFKTIVFLTLVYFIFFDSQDTIIENESSNANLEKIELFGPILDVNKLLEDINRVKKDKNIKGVLLEVNSPGGAVAPSVELAYAIKELSKIKPVVAYASGVIASGSYYASIWANKIIANPGSVVGSIGVIMQGVNAKELMEKIGVSTQVVKAGKYKETGTFSREWTSYEKEELQGLINQTYQMFVRDVAGARKLDVKNSDNFANARVFTAEGAKKVGLVDEVGTISKAHSSLIKLAKVEKAIWRKQDKFEKFMDRFLEKVSSKVSLYFSSGLKAY